MYNRNTQHSPGSGPTLQHPKPVPPPFALPSSPPIPDSQTFASSPYGHHNPQSSSTRARTSNEYQRFSSPPAQIPAVDIDPHQQGFYQTMEPSFVPPPAQFQQLPPQSQQHHQHHQQQHQNFWASAPGPNPAAGFQSAFGVNDVTAQMGMQFGQSAMRAGSDYVEKNVSMT